MLKPLTAGITTNCGNFFKGWEYQTTLPISWKKTCIQVKKQQLDLNMEKQIGSKLGKEYIKAVYFHHAYLTYMQSTSCKMPGWMKHKLESRLPGEISITSDKKRHLVPSSGPICSHPTSRQIDGETMDMVTLFSWAQKSLWMGTVAIKLKDACFLEEKLWKPRLHIKKQWCYSANNDLNSQSYGFPAVMYGCENWIIEKPELWRTDTFKCCITEDSWEFFVLQGAQTSRS